MKRAATPAALLAALLAGGCAGTPQQLPVGVSICSAVRSAHGLQIVAGIKNKAYQPIARLDLEAAFYQDFRYQTLTAFAQLPQELDPGQRRSIAFKVAEPGSKPPQGQAIRCLVTHIGYLDGSSADAAPAH